MLKKFTNNPLAKCLTNHVDLITALSIIAGLGYWVLTQEDRDNARYYTAWTEISTAPHAPITNSQTTPTQSETINSKDRNIPGPCENPAKRVGDSGRIIALEDLNNNDKSLAGAPLSYAVIPFVQLKEANLDRIDLHHADLFGAHLDGADLWGSVLQHVNLSFAHLEGAHLLYARLENACLQGAHLHQKEIEPIEGFLISINGKNFHLKTEVEQGHHVMRLFWPFSWIFHWFSGREWYFYYYYDRSHDDIKGDDIKVKTDMRSANLTCADLRGADLEGADLKKAHLNHANLSKFPLQDLESRYIKIEAYCDNLGNLNDPGKVECLKRYLKALNIDYPGMGKASMEPPPTNLTGADLTGADLTGAHARGKRPQQISTEIRTATKRLCNTTMPDGTREDCQESPILPSPCPVRVEE